jgi:hypothetical protein
VGDAEPDQELRELERELCRLPDVSAARIVVDDTGQPVEVHVLALPGKHPKQVVRDIQSVALASFGIDLDRRIVSVVQFGNDAQTGIGRVGLPRVVISAITAEANGLRSLVRVTLQRGEHEAVGFAEGSVASATRHRLVATATLDALRQLDGGAECLDVDSAQVLRAGTHETALVTIVFVVPPNEHLVSGSAVVRGHQEADAVARAVLDATNRRLPQIA